MAAMVKKGWQSQNTLGRHYFDHESNVLNDAGERKLFWIINNAPEQFRTVFVTKSSDLRHSEARLDSVQQALARLMPNQPLPEVMATSVEPRAWPADYIDTIDRKLQSTIPDPRLPEYQSAGN